ncbi:MAG: phosphate acyltransferase PlsX [Clostridia bacterium]|nr:phosphate acyltransferase PlsX [Clostridia bacterium]
MKIIVDCMSGDNAPEEILKGALLGKEKHGVDVICVGERDILVAKKNSLDISGVEIIEACGPHITMEDHPGDVMKPEKANSSMAVSLDLLKSGAGDAVVCAGNTGALLTGATLKIRRIKGIRRAALGAIIPLGSPTMLADAGAQTDCTPDNLLMFAIMGSLFMEKVMGISSPKVALVNNGAEEHKGTPLQSEAYQLLKNESLINFVGNIEGREIPEGKVDVMVSDGFTGNIVLKLCEGAGLFVKSVLKQLFYKNFVSKISALLVKGGLKELKKDMSYEEFGGAPFLGIAKPVIKAHGSANATSIAYCILQAKNYASSGMIEEIEKIAALKKEQVGESD